MRVIPQDLISSIVAQRLGRCSHWTLKRYTDKGRIRAWKRGGRWFYSRAEILGMYEVQGKEGPKAQLDKTHDEVMASLRAKGYAV